MRCTYYHRVAVSTLNQVPGGVDSRLALVANTDEMRRGAKKKLYGDPHFTSDGAGTLLTEQQRMVPAPSHGIEFLMNLTRWSTMRPVRWSCQQGKHQKQKPGSLRKPGFEVVNNLEGLHATSTQFERCFKGVPQRELL